MVLITGLKGAHVLITGKRKKKEKKNISTYVRLTLD